jgi:pyruvate dehydrogenase E1 component alpha subunit
MSDSIAVKADAYGFEGVQVDGNDPLAVLETVGDALASARDGDPVLVESLTYRQGPHTTSDDPSRYEDAADYPDWRTRDPLDRYEEFLLAEGAIDGATRSEYETAANEELDEAVERAEAEPEPGPDEVFDHVYEGTSQRLETQRTWLHDHVERHDVDGVER